MAQLEIQDLSFSYPGQERKTLSHVCCEITRGEFVCLAGPSGSGKTTLLRHLRSSLTPYGRREGTILLNGVSLTDLGMRAESGKIGFVLQNPEDQLVTDKVWHELAFGLESLGLDHGIIRSRVAEMASFFGIEKWFYQDVCTLSGGQKQLLNLASVMALQPELLVLDEPTGQLDPLAASDFLAALGRINRELGVTVIVAEQNLEEVLPMAGRVLLLDRGRLLYSGASREVGEALRSSGHAMFRALPAPMRIWAAVSSNLPCPVTVRDGRDWLSAYAQDHELLEIPEQKPPVSDKTAPAMELDEVWFRYEKEGTDILRGLSIKAYPGELLAVLGGNGAGKTTLLGLMSGLNKPQRGTVKCFGKDISKCGGLYEGLLGVLPQDPQCLFVKSSVKEDLLEMLTGKGLSRTVIDETLSTVIRLCRLTALLEQNPYDLSGGEKQRLALAKVLLTQPNILLLDEPTKGLDMDFKDELAKIFCDLLGKGITIIIVSHDIEFCARYAHRCALVFDGAVATEGTPRTFFSNNSFYTTAVSRMARDLLPEAVTAEDVIFACGGTVPTESRTENDRFTWDTWKAALPKAAAEEKKRIEKRTAMASVIILLTIPLTIWFGVRFLDDRKYLFISLLVLAETMAPFFMIFEGRKPRSRELVLLAVLCALAVAGRAVFAAFPECKPVLALVIISGAALGGESGFLIGAVTMLVSNMLFSQGPWTPWQMFAAGIVGFLAGVLFHNGHLTRKRFYLCIFGIFSAIFIYGGILNLASVIMYQASPTWEMILASLALGLPMDLVHAAATAIFIWFCSNILFEKLDRLKIKYGLAK